MFWILVPAYPGGGGEGGEEFEYHESIRKMEICDEKPFFQIILNKLLIMIR